MAGYTFTDELGAVLDLNDLTTYRVLDRGVSGVGMPTVELRTDKRSRRAGVELPGGSRSRCSVRRWARTEHRMLSEI